MTAPIVTKLKFSLLSLHIPKLVNLKYEVILIAMLYHHP